MNKEQLRKELEDCWKAGCNAMLYDLGHTATNHPDRDTYITTRLAALDDGTTVIEPINMDDDKEVVIKKIMKECARMLLTTYVMFELKEFMEVMVINEADKAEYILSFRRFDSHLKRFPLTPNPVDDGQEGRGLHWAVKLRWLLLEPGTHENNAFVRDVTGELETRFLNVNIQIGAALPVADGEGRNEKIKKEFSDNKEALLKGAKEVHKKMKSSAVTGGVKWVKVSDKMPDDNFYSLVRYNKNESGVWEKELGNKLLVKELIENGWTDVEYLSEGQPAQE